MLVFCVMDSYGYVIFWVVKRKTHPPLLFGLLVPVVWYCKAGKV